MRIGVISDTHGLLRPEVAPALAGVERILHLGDVGKAEFLRSWRRLRPSQQSGAMWTAKGRAANCRRPMWCWSRGGTCTCCTI